METGWKMYSESDLLLVQILMLWEKNYPALRKFNLSTAKRLIQVVESKLEPIPDILGIITLYTITLAINLILHACSLTRTIHPKNW